jgi:hypothetical protein
MYVADEYVYLLKSLNIFPQCFAFAADSCPNVNLSIDNEVNYVKD